MVRTLFLALLLALGVVVSVGCGDRAAPAAAPAAGPTDVPVASVPTTLEVIAPREAVPWADSPLAALLAPELHVGRTSYAGGRIVDVVEVELRTLNPEHIVEAGSVIDFDGQIPCKVLGARLLAPGNLLLPVHAEAIETDELDFSGSYTLAASLPGGEYRLEVEFEAGEEAGLAAWTGTIAADNPPLPRITSPRNGAADVPVWPTIEWTLDGAVDEIEFSLLPIRDGKWGVDTQVIEEALDGSVRRFEVPEGQPLQPGQPYRVEVKAIRGARDSTTVGEFTAVGG